MGKNPVMTKAPAEQIVKNISGSNHTTRELRHCTPLPLSWLSRCPVARLVFIAIFWLVLALGLIITLRCFMPADRTSCNVFGDEWLHGSETGKEACVFYAG